MMLILELCTTSKKTYCLLLSPRHQNKLEKTVHLNNSCREPVTQLRHRIAPNV